MGPEMPFLYVKTGTVRSTTTSGNELHSPATVTGERAAGRRGRIQREAQSDAAGIALHDCTIFSLD